MWARGLCRLRHQQLPMLRLQLSASTCLRHLPQRSGFTETRLSWGWAWAPAVTQQRLSPQGPPCQRHKAGVRNAREQAGSNSSTIKPELAGQREPVEPCLLRAPATSLAAVDTGTGMGTGQSCSRRCRAQHCSTGQVTASICRSCRLRPCTCGLWWGGWMLPAFHDRQRQEMENANNVTRKDSSQRDSSHLPQERPQHLGLRKSRGRRTPWRVWALPSRLYPGAAAPRALQPIPTCRDGAMGTQHPGPPTAPNSPGPA